MTKTEKIEALQKELAALRRELVAQGIVENHDVPRPFFKQRPPAPINLPEMLIRIEDLEAAGKRKNRHA